MVEIAHFRRNAPRSSHHQIASALGQEILSGVYPPGANLPTEQELLGRFNISRTVLREVIKTLSAKGLVMAKTRVGTRVMDPTHWNLFDGDVLAWKVDLGMDDDFRHSLLEIRQAVEPSAARLAAARRTPQDIRILRQCIAAMHAQTVSRESFAAADLDFHLAVGAASGNPLMRSLAGVIETALIASFSLSTPTESPDALTHTVDAHAAIVDAIEQGDGDAAAKAMLAVIDVGHERIESRRRSLKAPSGLKVRG